MAGSPYRRSERGLCQKCMSGRDSVRHYRVCVPRSKWPESMQDAPHTARVVIDGRVYDADKAPSTVSSVVAEPDFAPIVEIPTVRRFACDVCGRESASAAGNAAHGRSHVNAVSEVT